MDRIVNVASVAGKDGNANASAYSSAKAGVIALTKSLGKELAEKNIELFSSYSSWCKNKNFRPNVKRTCCPHALKST